MSYAYQTFTSGQVFTDGQAQQIEDNIRDHKHGVAGVGPSGASWSVSSKTAAFAVASTDVATVFKLYGDFQVDFAAAATLGGNFGAGFINASSGRIVLAAAAGQYIHDNSVYILTPGEALSVHSDAVELSILGGNPNGWARLTRIALTNSLAHVDITRMYPNDFERYELLIKPQLNSLGLVMLRYSQDSGSSFISANYTDTYGTTAAIRIGGANMNSGGLQYATCKFRNDRENSFAVAMTIQAMRLNGTTPTDEQTIGGNTANFGPINGLRIIAPATVAVAENGSMQSGTVIELYGTGRPRRT